MEGKAGGRKRRKGFNPDDEQPPAEPTAGAASSVVFIKNLPHGFYEEEIAGFFSQFGTLEKVKVARDHNTCRCKGYAFVQFKHADVAKIAAESMDDYILLENKLICKVCSMEWLKKRPQLFRNWQHKMNPRNKLQKKIQAANAPISEEQCFEMLHKQLMEDEKIQAALEEKCIEYEYPSFASLIAKQYSEDSRYNAWLKARMTKEKRAVSVDVANGKANAQNKPSEDAMYLEQESDTDDSLKEIESEQELPADTDDGDVGTGSDVLQSQSISLSEWMGGTGGKDEKNSELESTVSAAIEGMPVHAGKKKKKSKKIAGSSNRKKLKRAS